MSNDSTQPTDDPFQSQAEQVNTEESTPKEPWTAAKVVEWNNYYNLYVVLGLLFLAVVTSLNYFEESSIWASLRSGEITLSRGFPLTTDSLSYTSEGSRWVNLGWVFDTACAIVFRLGSSFASPEKAEIYGASAVTILHAIVRLATFLILLTIGQNRQWLWGRSVMLSLVILMGLGTGIVGPDMWGVLFLALLLRLMFLATELNRTWCFYAIPFLHMVWVNFDSSVTFGLILTTAWSLSLLLTAKRQTKPIARNQLIIVMLGSLLGCVVNPWTIFSYSAMFRLSNQYSMLPGGLFGSIQLPSELQTALLMRLALFVVFAGVSFWLNTTQFRLDRLALVVASALTWVIWLRYGGEFTMVVAIVAILNLEEWYTDEFGTEGRLDLKWKIFSIGGRSLTIITLFGLAAQHITGYGLSQGSATFGLGFNADRFPFEVANYLKSAQISGNVFNWNSSQGNALLWRAYPERKSFLDDRRNLFTEEIKAEREEIRKALKDDDKSAWQPLLDKYQISAVMIQAMSTSIAEAAAQVTLTTLSRSPNWIQIYDDGLVAIFGRADAPAEDLAFFETHRWDSDRIVFKSEDSLPPFTQPPSAASVLDEVIAAKALAMVQPHTQAAVRWLFPPSQTIDPEKPQLTPLANAIAAIREARRAIAAEPNQTQAYRVLTDAYRILHSQEIAVVSGIELTPANTDQIITLQAGPTPLGLRFRQRMTALNFAIMTSPRAVSESERQVQAALHGEYARMLLLANVYDLSSTHLRLALEVYPEASNAGDLRTQLAQLDELVLQRETEMNSMSLEEQANAMFRIQRALALGLVEPALADLREAEATGSSPDTIVPLLVDLYCQLGMADQAIPLMGNIGSKGMESTSGISSYRQGLVQALLGDYLGAYAGWANESIPVAELDEVRNGLIAGKMWVSGEFGPATRSFLDLPDQGRMVASRAFELGILHLEAGQPKMAADAFTKALKRGNDLDFAPLAKYYLEKLGQPFVEPASSETKSEAPTVPDPSDKKPEAVSATDSSEAKSVKPGPAEEKSAGDQAKKEAAPTQTGSQTNPPQKPD